MNDKRYVCFPDEEIIRTAKLNDEHRKQGELVFSPKVQTLSAEDQAMLIGLVSEFEDYENSIYIFGEHESGSVKYQGEEYYWQIDCQENPCSTHRTLTLMLSSEYEYAHREYHPPHPDEELMKIGFLNSDCMKKNQILISPKVQTLSAEDQKILMQMIRDYDSSEDDDYPFGEYNSGNLTHQGEHYIWNIDYFDFNLREPSFEPANWNLTRRVLTLRHEREESPKSHISL